MKKILKGLLPFAAIAAMAVMPAPGAYAETASDFAPKAMGKSVAEMTPRPAAEAEVAANRVPVHTRQLRKKGQLPMARTGVSFGSQKIPKGPTVYAPQNVASDMPTIYASLIYNYEIDFGVYDPGLVEVPRSEGNATMLIEGANATGGGVCIDDIYHMIYVEDFAGVIFNIIYEAYDINTFERVAYQVLDYDDPTLYAIGGLTLDPTTNQVYGITWDSSQTVMQLSKIDFNDGDVTSTFIGAFDINWNSIICDDKGQLYGISVEVAGDGYESNLYAIDKETAKITKIGKTGVLPYYQSGAVYDAKGQRILWNVCPVDGSAWMYEVDTDSGIATPLYQLPGGDNYEGMFILSAADSPKAPGECSNVEITRNGESLSGTITLTTPTGLYDGTAGSGNLDVKVTVDGKVVASKSNAGWGKSVTIPVTVDAVGKYSFAVCASNAEGDGPKARLRNVWFGPDTPAAPLATLKYENGTMKLGWAPVTGSVNGGYIDVENITYNVYDKDGKKVASGITETSYSENVTEPTDLTGYFYNVEAISGELVSAKGRSNVVALGYVVPPYNPDFTTENLDCWTVIDANDDGLVWEIQEDGSLEINFNPNIEMDDWLITPQLMLEAGKLYMLTFEARCNNSALPETIEVKYGKENTVAGMTETLLESTDLTNLQYKEFQLRIVPKSDGLHYVGFHGMSYPDQYFLFLRNISISGATSDDAPAAVTELKVTPARDLTQKATVSFVAPTKTIGGSNLSEITKIEVIRNKDVVKTFTNVTPGSQQSFEDVLDQDGVVTYRVMAYNNGGPGLSASASAFVGVNIPAAVTDVEISRTATDGEVLLTWEAVVKDSNGYDLPSDKVKYNVYVVDDDAETLVASDVEGTTYTFQAVKAGEQEFIQCVVKAVTTAGEGRGFYSDMIPVGTPYAEIVSSFPDGRMGKYPWVASSIRGGSMAFLTDASGVPSQDGDNGMVAFIGSNMDSGASFHSGLVSLSGDENPTLSFYVYDMTYAWEDPESADPDLNEVWVSVRSGNETDYRLVYGPETVSDICAGSETGWGLVTVSLGAYAGKVVQAQISAITQSYTYTAIDNIRIGKASGLAAVEAPRAKVGVDGSDIIVVGGEGRAVTVSAVNGMMVYKGLAMGHTVITPGAGLYIVRVGDKAWKVTVK